MECGARCAGGSWPGQGEHVRQPWAGGREGALPANVCHGSLLQVCNDGFGAEEASAVCRQLNLSSRGAEAKDQYGHPEFGPGAGPILAANLACPGGARSLQGCTWGNASDCSHAEDVGINCTGRPRWCCSVGHTALALPWLLP